MQDGWRCIQYQQGKAWQPVQIQDAYWNYRWTLEKKKQPKKQRRNIKINFKRLDTYGECVNVEHWGLTSSSLMKPH